MSYIFVSYSHHDAQKVTSIVGNLLDAGYPVWQDSLNLRGGSEWATEIDDAIQSASYFLLIWSSNTLGSYYVLDKEIPHARLHNTKIIPVIVSGEMEDIPEDVQKLQVIDLRHKFSEGIQQVKDAIPLPDNVKPIPKIADQLKKADSTFGAAKNQWQTSLTFEIDSEGYMGLLIDRSQYDIKSYLLGHSNDTFRKPDAIQVYIQTTGNVSWNTFDEYLRFVRAKQMRVWTILVRGPIRPTQRGEGLEYYLPTDHSDDAKIWNNLVGVAWNSVNKVSDTNTPLHLFIQGPVALGAAFGASQHLMRHISIYHQDRSALSDDKRYFKAFDYSF